MVIPTLLSVSITLAYFLYSNGIRASSLSPVSYPPSSVAHNQLSLWSKYVHNQMPEVLLPKLSPMSKQDLSYFNSLLSKPTFVADAKFCSTAQLACSYSNQDQNRHITNPSQGSKLIDYWPYGPYAANASRGSEPSMHTPYGLENTSQTSKLIKYIPYGPYFANASQKSEQSSYKENVTKFEQSSYRENVTKLSPSQGLDDPHVFFRLSVLKIGNKVHIPKVLNHRFPHRSFLPFPIAKKIMMSSHDIERVFPESFGSPTTRDAVLSTTFYCNAPAIKEETKSCPKSLEEMLGFSKALLGKNLLSVLTTESGRGSGTNLLIQNIKQFGVKKLVACHELFFPFATYFCHSLPSTNLYRITLVEVETGVPINKVLAICHMDTSGIPADHISLRVLNLSPGQAEACHWMLETDLIWIDEGESMV